MSHCAADQCTSAYCNETTTGMQRKPLHPPPHHPQQQQLQPRNTMPIFTGAETTSTFPDAAASAAAVATVAAAPRNPQAVKTTRYACTQQPTEANEAQQQQYHYYSNFDAESVEAHSMRGRSDFGEEMGWEDTAIQMSMHKAGDPATSLLPMEGHRDLELPSWHHQTRTWHDATNVAAAGVPTNATNAASSHGGTHSMASTPLVHPSVWICLHSPEEEQQHANLPRRDASAVERENGRYGYGKVYPPSPAAALLVSEPEESASVPSCKTLQSVEVAAADRAVPRAASDASPFSSAADCVTPLWNGEETSRDARDSAVSLTAAAKGTIARLTMTLSSCLPTDRMEQTSSLLQSPLLHSLHPFPSELQIMSPNNGVDFYADGGNSLVTQDPPRYDSAIFSPEPEGATSPAKRNARRSTAPNSSSQCSENWEAKRVRHVSATRRSVGGSPLSNSASGRSFFSATLRSPAPQARSNSASGTEGLAGHRRSTDSDLREVPVPAWTSLSPATHDTIPVVTPLLPRTLSAPPLLRNSSNASAAAAAAGVAAAADKCYEQRLTRRSPAPPSLGEDRQRGYVPLSLRGSGVHESPRPSRRAPWLAHHCGRRYSLPQQDSEAELDALPFH